MPHHASEDLADWRGISRRAGMNYVSPREPVEKTALAIGSSRLLVTEALHGAVAADSFGVPWIAVRLGSRVLDFKWEDWCRSLSVPYRPLELPLVLQATLKRSRLLRHALKRGVSACGLGKKKWARLPLAKSTPEELARAAEFLARVPGSAEPILSEESRRERLAGRLLEQLDRLRRDFRPRQG
jgi:succinoglycan biosynthesis protein ExoV